MSSFYFWSGINYYLYYFVRMILFLSFQTEKFVNIAWIYYVRGG